MAHAPINTFKNEKENLSSTATTDEEKNKKTSETVTEVPSKPIFGTFGKNLTSKVASTENGNGDPVEDPWESTRACAGNPMGTALEKGTR